MFVLFTARRNPNTVPYKLITPATLEEVAQSYDLVRLPSQDMADASVLWDIMHEAGIESLGPEVRAVPPNSVLHRWIVYVELLRLQKVFAARRYSRVPEPCRESIESAVAWLASPNEQTSKSVVFRMDRSTPITEHMCSISNVPATVIRDPGNANVDFFRNLDYGRWSDEARKEFQPNAEQRSRSRQLRPLAALYSAGILPAPPPFTFSLPPVLPKSTVKIDLYPYRR